MKIRELVQAGSREERKKERKKERQTLLDSCAIKRRKKKPPMSPRPAGSLIAPVQPQEQHHDAHRRITRMKASDVLVHLKQPSHKTGSVSELRHLWVTSLTQDHGQTFIHLTQKQVGQLSHFMNRCPSGSARDILRWTLAHWPQFSKDCESIHGAKNTPIIPQIGFLLIHANVAIQMAVEALGKAQKKWVAKKKAPIDTEFEENEDPAQISPSKIAQKQLMSKLPNHPQTLAEIMAPPSKPDKGQGNRVWL